MHFQRYYQKEMAGKGRFYPLLEEGNIQQPQIANNTTAQNGSTALHKLCQGLNNDELDQKCIIRSHITLYHCSNLNFVLPHYKAG